MNDKKPHPIKIRNQSYVKHYNIQTVLRVLEEFQPVSRTEMVRLTEMSPTSITRIINALINLGLIYETDSVPKSSRGRKAINLCVKQDGIYTMGIFLTYDRIRTCIMDYGNHILYSDLMQLEERYYDVEELAAYLRLLLKIGFLNEKKRPIVSFEIKPFGEEDPEVCLANAKRTLDLAWELV